MAIVREMPVLTVAQLIRETDQRLWRVMDHYVPKARKAVDMSDVHAIGVDETCSRRGHDYITLFVDLEGKRLFFATPGKDAQTVAQFAEDLQAHGGCTDAVTEVSMDLSPAFQKGAAEHLPIAQITFDRFHLMKLINEAVDAVRHGEALPHPDFKKIAGFGSRTQESTRPNKKNISRTYSKARSSRRPKPTSSASLYRRTSPSRTGRRAQFSPMPGWRAKTSGYHLVQVRLHPHEPLGRPAPLVRKSDQQRHYRVISSLVNSYN